CSNCGTTKTPLWRRAPNGDTICNACGLFLKARNAPRPVTDCNSSKDMTTAKQGRPLQCSNCGTRTTPLWRRDLESNIICNACGLYYRLHNAHRPITMKRTMIKRRKR
ncbi:iron transporter biosynthesis regulating transcription factor, partial [Zychaea mexicana]|uniref:iron transporter biosynthesis regulating transcription factor n=1 Tax=Zychaea mexicana TaxID=64656 RepID=UPI0022FF40BC